MRGLLGDATEEFVETLDKKKEEDVDNEQVYRMAGVMCQCAGLEVRTLGGSLFIYLFIVLELFVVSSVYFILIYYLHLSLPIFLFHYIKQNTIHNAFRV